MSDLGAWVTGQYRIPGSASEPEAEDGDGDPNGDDAE